MPKKLYIILLRKRIFLVIMLLLQLGLIVALIINGSRLSVWIEYALTIISLFVAIHVVGENTNNAYKLIWVALILALPVLGGSLYLFFNYQPSMKRLQNDFALVIDKSKDLFFLPDDIYKSACEETPVYRLLMQYLQKLAGFPVYGHTKAEYLTPGEIKFNALMEIIKKAEKYIFLEYFSIESGIMWNTILEILKEKAACGVEVRIIYDDVGCLLLLPKDYPESLAKMGIKGMVFNPMRPVLTSKQNTRDHRKIAVVDGKVAITGGINLADEYINALDKYGHWKDSSVKVEGEAAWSFTLMFLQLWSVCTKTDEDFSQFYPWHESACDIPGNGFIQPYADSPLDDERVSENVYLQIIGNAKEYIYINTPYLVIDDSMITALTLAAKSGVDVRIVTPHHPDKQYVHIITRSYYQEFIKAGIKVYEYSDGFIHSKTFVSDDIVATVGTANLDYRSLYLSFECGACIYNSSTVVVIRDDFIKTLERCRLITEDDCKVGRVSHFIQDIMQLVAPLL